MNRFAYYMSGYAFKAFSGIARARITIHGQEKIPKGSLIFTANHFTRMETVFLPYHIHEITKKPVWSLADAELFQGGLKGILDAMGAVSTRDPQRDFIIVKSLLAGDAECIIFPEGMMVKNKKITSDGEFRLYQDGEIQHPHTGAAILALTTEFYRERLRRMQSINPDEFNRLVTLYELLKPEKVLEQQTFIVPVNITYYPLRARENVLSRIALNIMENPSERMMEELLTEGTMLFSGVDVDIRFGDPIAIRDYLFNSFVESDVTSRRRVNFSNRLSSHHVMKAAANDIMKRYMTGVYKMTTLNHDHIFACILKYMPQTGEEGIDEYDFRCRAYLGTFACAMSLYCNFHKSLYENQIHILTDDRFHRYEEFLNLALETEILEMRDGKVFKNHTKFDSPSAFHSVRIENPISVIANEVEPLSRLQAYFADLAMKPFSEIELLMTYRIEDRQFNEYINDFKRYVSPVAALPGKPFEAEKTEVCNPEKTEVCNPEKTEVCNPEKTEVYNAEKTEVYNAEKTEVCNTEEIAVYNNGSPRLLKSDCGDTGVLLIHDYLSTPGELLPFAGYLQKKGFTVYLPRLPGHGTAPENLSEIRFTQWIEAVEEGLVLLRSLCRKKIVGGLGLGGMLGLALQDRAEDMDALFMVAPPSKMKDYPSEFLPSGRLWNQMMKRAGLPGDKKDTFKTYSPDNPCDASPGADTGADIDIAGSRYLRYPVAGLKQVEMLLAQIESEKIESKKIKSKKIESETTKYKTNADIPLLMIQSRNNPFIDPEGSRKLFDLVPASVKEYYLFNFDRHGILNGKGADRVYNAITGFVESIYNDS